MDSDEEFMSTVSSDDDIMLDDTENDDLSGGEEGESTPRYHTHATIQKPHHHHLPMPLTAPGLIGTHALGCASPVPENGSYRLFALAAQYPMVRSFNDNVVQVLTVYSVCRIRCLR